MPCSPAVVHRVIPHYPSMYLVYFKLNCDWFLKVNRFHSLDTNDYDVRVNIQGEITKTKNERIKLSYFNKQTRIWYSSIYLPFFCIKGMWQEISKIF